MTACAYKKNEELAKQYIKEELSKPMSDYMVSREFKYENKDGLFVVYAHIEYTEEFEKELNAMW